ncbi:hypothetical protein AB4369_25985, partial [Vibrio sp. 10N.261.49.A5]
MARPKSYTDDDLINIATQLSVKGKKPTGWYIKEILGRGKISSIQADLDRLTKSGKVPEIPEPNNDKDGLDWRSLRAYFELPVEIQEMLTKKEQDVCKSLRDMAIGLNNKAQHHYEALMDARVRELDIKSDAAIKAKEIAEEDVEARLRKQVEHNEFYEEKSDALEAELTHSKQKISELAAKLSRMETTHAEVLVKLDYATNELNTLKIHHSALSEQHEEAKERLIETATQLQSTQGLLN